MQLVTFNALPEFWQVAESVAEAPQNFQARIRITFKQTTGITTGLICACQVANLFLLGLDKLWISWAQQTANSTSLTISFLYKRFIDDVLIGHHPSISPLEVAQVLSGFDSSIVVTHDTGDSNDGISFLDLLISQSDLGGEINYAMYRKPQNLYTYLPFTSECPHATKKAVVDSELFRIDRNCRLSEDRTKEQQFFQNKLSCRAYPTALFKERLKAFEARQMESRVQVQLENSRIVPFKLPYGKDIEQLGFLAVAKKHSWKLFVEAKFKQRKCDLRFVATYLASPNLFRIRYRRFLGA